MRVPAFATNTKTGGHGGQGGTRLADLELRHRRRARCENRITVARDNGLTNLPSHGFDAGRIWCALVALAIEITSWMQMLTLAGHEGPRTEPERLRHSLFTVPVTLVRTALQVWLHIWDRAPWAALVHGAIARLRASARPG